MSKIVLDYFGKIILNEDEVDDKWKSFVTGLTKDFQLVDLNHSEIDLYLSVQYDRWNFLQLDKKKNIKKILVVIEPKCVSIQEYKKAIQKKFDHVIINKNFSKINSNNIFWDVGFMLKKHIEKNKFDFNKVYEDEIAFLATNKFSFIKNNNYKYREKVILKLVKNGLKIHLAGAGWEYNNFKYYLLQIKEIIYCFLNLEFPNLLSIRKKINFEKLKNIVIYGKIDSEDDFLEKFRFNLVIENNDEYISEKIFNAIFSGAVPIYINDNDFPLPLLDNFIIKLKKDFTIEELVSKMKSFDHNFFKSNYKSLLYKLKFNESLNRDESYFFLIKCIKELEKN